MKLLFCQLTLDLAARQLFRGGSAVPLEPKMYELLEVLIKRRATVVTNNELDELLWPKVYVARTSLTRLVSELRAVLGDSPRESRIIRTVYKIGYVFCADVLISGREVAGAVSMDLIWNGRAISLPEGEHIAGRDSECSIVIDAVTVSRRHARITIASGRAVIEDLRSTNGTHVDGARISAPTSLSAGQSVALGTERIDLRLREGAALTVKVDEAAR